MKTKDAGSVRVDRYIDDAPLEAQEKLRELRAILREVAPKATETVKWGYPVLEEKRIIFSYSAHKTHLNFMPTRSTLEPFKKELADYTTGKDTIQFLYDKPLPKELICKIATFRAREVQTGALWMHQT